VKRVFSGPEQFRDAGRSVANLETLVEGFAYYRRHGRPREPCRSALDARQPIPWTKYFCAMKNSVNTGINAMFDAASM